LLEEFQRNLEILRPRIPSRGATFCYGTGEVVNTVDCLSRRDTPGRDPPRDLGSTVPEKRSSPRLQYHNRLLLPRKGGLSPDFKTFVSGKMRALWVALGYSVWAPLDGSL
jgi:hypothetical protein